MTRHELEHVLRAAAAIADEKSFVVVGSQAVLLAFADASAALPGSREIGLYPALHPDRADLIDGAIGALSSFDETFGYHADGVGPETAVMPDDWMARSSRHCIGDIDDLAVSKCVAGREKDADFVRTLLKERMIDLETLRERIGRLPPTQAVRSVLASADRRAAEAATL